MTRATPEDPSLLPPAPLAPRFGAMLYDSLLLLAVLIVASGLALVVTGGEPARPGQPVLRAWLVVACFLFLGWFWTHGGQTLGMRAWRLRVQAYNGAGLTWRQALIRFLAAFLSLAPLGLGFWWVLVDPDRLAWHDRISGTVVVRLSPASVPARKGRR